MPDRLDFGVDRSFFFVQKEDLINRCLKKRKSQVINYRLAFMVFNYANLIRILLSINGESVSVFHTGRYSLLRVSPL